MAADEKSWVWFSTPESIRDEKLSLLAVLEVAFAVAAYWWIAVTWQTHLHLLVSLIAAPLVLLRSDNSVATAQRRNGCGMATLLNLKRRRLSLGRPKTLR